MYLRYRLCKFVPKGCSFAGNKHRGNFSGTRYINWKILSSSTRCIYRFTKNAPWQTARLTGGISPETPPSGECLSFSLFLARLNARALEYSKRSDKLHARQVVYAIRLGTFNRRHRSGEDTIVFVYEEAKTTGQTEVPNLDVVGDRLLVPSSVTSKGSEYPVEGIRV